MLNTPQLENSCPPEALGGNLLVADEISKPKESQKKRHPEVLAKPAPLWKCFAPSSCLVLGGASIYNNFRVCGVYHPTHALGEFSCVRGGRGKLGTPLWLRSFSLAVYCARCGRSRKNEHRTRCHARHCRARCVFRSGRFLVVSKAQT